MITAVIVAVGMVLGFGREFPAYVIHPKVSRPLLLAFHAAVFSGWFIVYFAQIALIRLHRPTWHRWLGWIGAGLAMTMAPLGIATALVMRRFDILAFHSTNRVNDLAFLATPLADIVVFTPCALAGIKMRQRPDYHRRFMYLATACIAEAGFGRLPIPGAGTYFYLSNLPLYLAAIIYDKVTLGRVHPVNAWAIPMIVGVELGAMILWFGHPAWWVQLCGRLTGLN